jgi:general secretion pathway protein I
MHAPERRGDSPAEAGFTLVEVLVAFTVAAMLLGTLLQLFATGLRSVGQVTREVEATLLAESSLEQFGRDEPLQESVDQRRLVNRYTVHLHVHRRDDLIPPGPLSALVTPYDIDVAVSWLDGWRQRSVTLHTLRLGGGR